MYMIGWMGADFKTLLWKKNSKILKKLSVLCTFTDVFYGH